MQDWGGGYVTDIEYVEGFYADQSPLRMALAAAINGVEAPDFSKPFTYCELGCGRGVTSAMLAAIHPQGQFHAIDFNPAHIAHARSRAEAAGLDNIAFHECSFADLAGPEGQALPMFDVITMHGVWSWIAADLQEAIVAFMNQRLKPGGLVYVSFNALPGWTTVAPVQRLLRELAVQSGARSDIAAERAMSMLERLAATKLLPESMETGLKRVRKAFAEGQMSYVVHEYLNRNWQPLFHLDVAAAFSRAKLSLAASTDLLRNFYNISLSAEQRTLLAEIDSPELRETIKDFSDDVWFRKDVYVRGPRRMSGGRREAVLRDLELTLMRPPPKSFHVDRPDGSTWHPEPLVYQPILQALSRRPHRVSELLTLPDIPPQYGASAVEVIGVLVGSNLAALRFPVSPEAAAAVARLNGLIDAGDPARLMGHSILAVPALGIGLSMSAFDLTLYAALSRPGVADPAAVARDFVGLCRRGGVPLMIDEKEVEDDTEAEGRLAAEFAERMERAAPLWSMMGLTPAAS